MMFFQLDKLDSALAYASTYDPAWVIVSIMMAVLSSYAALNATVTASGGSISLLKVRQLWNAIADGPVRPNMIITDYTTWAYFEQLLTPFQRNVMSNLKIIWMVEEFPDV